MKLVTTIVAFCVREELPEGEYGSSTAASEL